MSKITLEFDSFEDADEALNAINGSKWKCAMWELDQHYRSQYKYSENDKDIEEAERVREKIREILNDNELIL